TATLPMVIDPVGTPTKSRTKTTKRIAIAPKQIASSSDPAPVFTAAKVKQLATRKIVVEERAQIAEAVADEGLASVDMEIYFSYNSSAIEPEALPAPIALGQALSDQRLAGGTFMIAGHTDATGSDYYNQSLSERRASSVKAFLVQAFHLDPNALIAVGYG